MYENSSMKDSNAAPSAIASYSVERACSRAYSSCRGTPAGSLTLRTFPLTRIVMAVGVHSTSYRNGQARRT